MDEELVRRDFDGSGVLFERRLRGHVFLRPQRRQA